MDRSVMVITRLRSAQGVGKAYETQGDEATEKLQGQLAPFLQDGEEMPDLRLAGHLMIRWMFSLMDDLIEADRTHLEELADDDQPRRERNAAFAELVEAFRGLRSSCEGLYGRDYLKPLGFTPRTPRDPLTLVQQAEHLQQILRDPHKEHPQRRFKRLDLDPEDLADELDEPLEVLQKALDKVATEIKEADNAHAVKEASMEKYNEFFTYIARWLEAVFTLAGMKKQAGRIRPSTTRPGQTERDPDEPDEDDEDEADENDDEADGTSSEDAAPDPRPQP